MSTEQKGKLGWALHLISTETQRAVSKFMPFNSAHEGISVIREEFEELWDEVKTNPKDWQKIEEEAVQLGAMAVRFLVDLEHMRGEIYEKNS